MAKYLKDGSESPVKTFSLRLPHKLAEEIDARANVNRRPRNAEIQLMLEQYLDLIVARESLNLKSNG